MEVRGGLEKVLEEYNGIIDSYYSLDVSDGELIMKLLKKLSVVLSYLETHRIVAHKEWNSILFNRSGSVAAAEVEAHTKVPELYQLRRLMQAGYRIVDAMRSNVSLFKSERQLSNVQT